MPSVGDRPCRRCGSLPGVGRVEPDQRLGQLGLAVALHAGERVDLAAAHGEATRRRRAPRRSSSTTVTPSTSSTDVAGLGRLLVDGELHRPADHQRGQLVGRVGRLGLADDLAAADHGDRVGDRADLAQLVGDEDDRRAAVAQRAHDRDQLVGLLRREHGGRLVQDQQLGVAAQRLDDLDPLLDADRQVARPARRAARRGRSARRSPRTSRRARRRSRKPSRRCLLVAEHDVLGDGEDRDEHEVLVHHADAGRASRRRDRVKVTGSSSTRISPSSGW